jgi:hypothetical protein
MWKEPPGQATYEMANLRPERTGLPFVVFISQRAGANHAVRVKVSQGARVHPHNMGVYAVKPSGTWLGQRSVPATRPH